MSETPEVQCECRMREVEETWEWACRAKDKQLTDFVAALDAAEAERNQIRSELTTLRQRAEAAERELTEERERMDWLEAQRNFETYPVLQSECTGYMRVLAIQNCPEYEGKTLRVAIDAARKPEVQR